MTTKFNKNYNTRKKFTNNTIVIAMYRRVSTDEQAMEGKSIEVQKEQIENYIKMKWSDEIHNIKILDYCDAGYSAGSFDRPAMKKLLLAIEQREIDYIIVTKFDRLSRRIIDMEVLIEKVNKYNIGLLSITEDVNTRSASGRTYINVLEMIAQMERQQTSERVHNQFIQLCKRQPLGGTTPFGYFYIKTTDNQIGKYYIYNEENCRQHFIPPIKLSDDTLLYPALIVSEIFNWYVSLKNMTEIARKLNELAIPTNTQINNALKAFSQLTQQAQQLSASLWIESPKKWNQSTIRGILRNSIYIGTKIYNRRYNLFKSMHDEHEWITIDNVMPPIISKEVFSRVQELIHYN